uniref:Clip domain-containing protein n=1 Tax=Caenorhabditis tropicalis TaxID=1561998 RepID=A0A1I7TRA5_9PELO
MIILELFLILPLILGEKVKRNDQVTPHEIPKFKRGPIVIVDETALTNPNSFDYDFSDDLNKPADKQDLYDQFIDQLPMFHIYKLGTDRGVTQVPIVTRAGDTWFTPSTISNREQKFTFYLTTPMTPKKPSTTTSAPRRTTTTPVPTTESTTRRSTTTTSVSTTTKAPSTTTASITTRRPLLPKQPAPVFKVHTTTTTTETPVINRGPIWRKGGVIIDTTTSPRPLTTPRQWTVRGFRVRVTTEAPTRRTTTVAPTRRTTTTQAPTRRTTTTVAPTTPWWRTTTPSRWVAGHVDPISRSQPKPVVIHTGRYAGPTYNCRVLNPFTDGQPSAEHDSSCKMLYPGLSLDGTCRCFYKVAGRDEHGCATGFIYACRALGLRSISI